MKREHELCYNHCFIIKQLNRRLHFNMRKKDDKNLPSVFITVKITLMSSFLWVLVLGFRSVEHIWKLHSRVFVLWAKPKVQLHFKKINWQCLRTKTARAHSQLSLQNYQDVFSHAWWRLKMLISHPLLSYYRHCIWGVFFIALVWIP